MKRALSSELVLATIVVAISFLLSCSCDRYIRAAVGARVVYWKNAGAWIQCSNRPPHDFAGIALECQWRCAIYRGDLHHVVVRFPVDSSHQGFGPETVTEVGGCR